jgi:signal transduction histidine kinase/CheY-like chemotaxis protein
MAARTQFSEFEELSWLRRRVAELELKVSERDAEVRPSSGGEGRELFETLLNHISGPAWIDEPGRRILENEPFRRFEAQSDAAAVARLSQASDGATVEGFSVKRFEFRSTSGKQLTGGVAVPLTGLPQAGLPQAEHSVGFASQALCQTDLIGILECDGDRIVDACDSFLKWLGYERGALTDPGLDWRALTPKRYRVKDDEALGELRATGAFAAYDKEFLSKQGVAVPVCIGARRIRKPGADDGSVSFLAFVQNASERRQLEGRLLRAQKLESLGLIAGGVAHDFNNMLATITGNAGMSLEALSLGHPAYRHMNEVLVASRRASNLTQQMLAYCGRASVQVEALDLSATVREIGSLLRTTISKKIELTFQMAADLPSINADPGQVQQVVMNLVINASDAIGEQAGEIVVSTFLASGAAEDSPGTESTVCFEVRDTGCGMTEETRARVFDPFFSTKAEGRGLGLSAVRGIVGNHGGELTVESEPGVGTTFRVLFPAGGPPLRRAPAAARRELSGTETILVADDDESIRRMTRAALERFGYRVILAANGSEALEAFRTHRGEISAVLLDWAMPVMNGDEALAAIIAVDPDAQVVMTSGYAETETLGRAGPNPLAAFIQKPYTTSRLAEKLREAIARRASLKK